MTKDANAHVAGDEAPGPPKRSYTASEAGLADEMRWRVAVARSAVERTGRYSWPADALTPDDCVRLGREREDPLLFTIGTLLATPIDQRELSFDFAELARTLEGVFRALYDDMDVADERTH